MRDDFPLDRRTAADILADTETSATVLHMIVLAAYGDALYGNPDTGEEPMDPVDLWLSIEEDFRVSVPESNENKLNALMLAISTNAFYEDPLAFISICNALYSGDLGDLVDGAMEDITVPEMLWGIYEVELNRGDHADFVPSVDAVINETIAEEAEEKEELEESEVVPHYESFVKEMRDDMLAQLRNLGISEDIIRHISKEDLTPAKETDVNQI